MDYFSHELWDTVYIYMDYLVCSVLFRTWMNAIGSSKAPTPSRNVAILEKRSGDAAPAQQLWVGDFFPLPSCMPRAPRQRARVPTCILVLEDGYGCSESDLPSGDFKKSPLGLGSSGRHGIRLPFPLASCQRATNQPQDLMRATISPEKDFTISTSVQK